MKDKKKIFLIGGVIFGIVILIITAVLLTGGSNTTKGKDLIKTSNGKVKIVKNEASKVEFEDYKTNEFSLKIPKGWKVDTIGDYIHYTIKAYNPENPTYQFFFNFKTEGYNKTQ